MTWSEPSSDRTTHNVQIRQEHEDISTAVDTFTDKTTTLIINYSQL